MKTMLLALLLGGLALADQVTGYYVGGFEAARFDGGKNPMWRNKINLSIDSLQKDLVKGHSVVAGNSRPFEGKVTGKQGRQFLITAREPGDDPYDGVFKFVLDPVQHTASGRWIANDAKLAVPERKFRLERTTFRYQPEQALKIPRNRFVYDTGDTERGKGEYITPDAAKFNASKVRLRSQDVENMYRRDLEVMRNAIYARHGYSFQNRQMRVIFDDIDWYIPVSVDVTAELTELEKANIELLKRYENHAATYYDRFGR
ncbi:MAG: YARHG domain-containing protein [Vulcanimicrobiota bacterium]